MRVQRNRDYAILTGDVVESSRLSAAARKTLPRSLHASGKAVQQAFAKACPIALQAFRGDSWQLLVTDAALSLRVSLYFRAMLRVRMDKAPVDTRISIGIGKIDFLPGDRVSEGDGEAYRLSGRGLDEMERRTKLAVRLARQDGVGLLGALVEVVDVLATAWTPAQARAMLGTFVGETQEVIAQGWKPRSISQQAVAQHLDRANGHAVGKALDAYEDFIA